MGIANLNNNCYHLDYSPQGLSVYETLLITFREGLEAFLMVAVATLFLRKTGRGALVMAVRSGLGVSIVGSVLLGVLLARVGSMSPLWEGILALLAAAAVVWCVTHMRKMGRHMGSEIASGLGKASVLDGPRAWWAVFGFTCFMVGREGIETAAMLASLAGNSELRHMVWGGAIGVAIAASVAWAWVRFGRAVDLSRFFNVTALFMLAFAAMLLFKAFHEFTEGALIPGIDNAWWHVATEGLAEGFYAQMVSVTLVLAPTLWLLVAHWRDRTGRSSVATQPQ
jgi:high-affinity iron transporter